MHDSPAAQASPGPHVSPMSGAFPDGGAAATSAVPPGAASGAGFVPGLGVGPGGWSLALGGGAAGVAAGVDRGASLCCGPSEPAPGGGLAAGGAPVTAVVS